VRSRLSAAASGVREAKLAVSSATDHLGTEITEARHAGVPWSTIAESVGISIQHAMSLIKVNPERVTLSDVSGDVTLMSVYEYAGYAGLSNMTVYKHIRMGLLPSIKNERGKLRVVVPG
jgi:hypothetical protein